jgi:hypothetical protein
MEQGIPLEIHSFPSSQEIPHVLWIPEVHYHFQNSLPLFFYPKPDSSLQFL